MDITKYIDEFGVHLGTAIDAIKHAACVYYGAISQFGQTAQDKFEERYPQVTTSTWAKLRMIGAGDLNPSAMFFSDKFCAKVARMPVSVQNDVLNGDSFDVFNPTTRVVDKVRYADMKPRHERIVFDDSRNTIRSINEQIAYCKIVEKEKKEAHNPYTVMTDRVVVHSACVIGKSELIDIVEEMQ